MTRRQIDQSREIRLWMTQIVLPAVGLAFVIPESRKAIIKKATDIKDSIKERKQKKKEES